MTWVGRRPAAKSLLNVPSDIPSISFAWDRKKRVLSGLEVRGHLRRKYLTVKTLSLMVLILCVIKLWQLPPNLVCRWNVCDETLVNMAETEDGYPGEGEEYEEEYHYQDWGVDRVDLDFQSGYHHWRSSCRIFHQNYFPTLLSRVLQFLHQCT